MRVYLKTEAARLARRQNLYVSPASDPAGQDGPSEWRDAKGDPLTLSVPFAFGMAEVPDPLGRYLIATGHAARTALILPASSGS